MYVLFLGCIIKCPTYDGMLSWIKIYNNNNSITLIFQRIPSNTNTSKNNFLQITLDGKVLSIVVKYQECYEDAHSHLYNFGFHGEPWRTVVMGVSVVIFNLRGYLWYRVPGGTFTLPPRTTEVHITFNHANIIPPYSTNKVLKNNSPIKQKWFNISVDISYYDTGYSDRLF